MRTSALPLLPHLILKGTASTTVRQHQKQRRYIRKEEVKLFVFTDDIMYADPKEFTKKKQLVELIN